jgi:ACS family hexuronate transporter-like MFS transporter
MYLSGSIATASERRHLLCATGVCQKLSATSKRARSFLGNCKHTVVAVDEANPTMQVAGRAPTNARSALVGRHRWLICALLFLITVNNYMDRQILSIAAPAIVAEYAFTNADVATIANAFLVAYTVGQLFAGLLVDRIGARRGMTLAVLLWSGMSLLVTLSRSVPQFSVVRFLLGLAESVNYPAGVKVCAEWFPAKERATAVGLFQSGSAIGAMITPAIAAWLIVQFGWRAAFVVVALPGVLWLPFWLRHYAPLDTHTRVSEAERRYILFDRSNEAAVAHARQIPWSFFLKQRQVLAIAAARFLEEPSGWFYFTWLPIYLKTYRGIPLTRVGVLLIIPFLALDIGKVGGGWVSSRLITHGWTLDRARKIVMLVSALCMLASIPAMWAATPLASVLYISLATFGHGCWATTTQTIPGDIVEPRFVGTVYGITAFGGGVGAIIFTYATGQLVDAYGSFTIPFVIAGVLPLVGYAAFVGIAGRIRPVPLDLAVNQPRALP